MIRTFPADIMWDDEIRQYIGIVPILPGAHSQGNTIEELHENLKDVIQLCMEELTEEEIAELPVFIGTHNISLAV